MLGPHFLYALFAYPDNPKNEHWPFYRQVRPLLAQGRRLATPDDVVVQSMGIAGRAFDIPPPLDHPSIAHAVIVDAATERAFEESRKAFPAAYIRVFMYGSGSGQGSGSGSGSTQVGRWRVVDLVPGLPPVALTVFEALRRSRLDSLPELDRAMCSHVVARVCCSSEAAACASSPPPGRGQPPKLPSIQITLSLLISSIIGGTAAYRDWRDRLCASAVERCMRQLAEAAIAAEAPTTLAGETCAAARGRAMVAAQDAGKLIGRWLSFSEAESFVDAAACAAAAAACACRQTDAAGKQHVLDMLDAVMRMNLSKPVGVSSPDARLAAFYTIHDALVSCLVFGVTGSSSPNPSAPLFTGGVNDKRPDRRPPIADAHKERRRTVRGCGARQARICAHAHREPPPVAVDREDALRSRRRIPGSQGPAVRHERRPRGGVRLPAPHVRGRDPAALARRRREHAGLVARDHPAVRSGLPGALRGTPRCDLRKDSFGSDLHY